MSMLKNAVDSIRLGVDDFKAADADEARALSCVRNLTAGLLLLFKVKLQAMSPPGSDEVLLKQDVRPRARADGQIEWIGAGKKTVDVRSIVERLTWLGVDNIDWKLLDTLTKIRNDVEHYHSTRPTAALLETVANCFHLIQQFVPSHLDTTPVSLLGSDVWTFLTDHKAFYERERKECLESLRSVDWPSNTLESSIEHLECPSCKAKLVKAVGDDRSASQVDYSCTRCEASSRFDQVVDSMLHGQFFKDMYLAATRGGEYPLDYCEHCDKASYVMEERRCAICGDSAKPLGCRQCGSTVNEDEASESESDLLCGICRYQLEMD
ncbi:hypothetical protein [Pseudomonas putida]|uniref:hypothetical protein n=1 Tax=Pseudomonas putida TaxID=303 RepID=UPI000CC3D6D3|nr:hypothetical protein [Pseudomonas putida]PNG87230.1 hypothetical protein CBL13_01088 [Pseudomonas putida]